MYDGHASCGLRKHIDTLEGLNLHRALQIFQWKSPDYSLMETHKDFYEDLVLWSILSTGQARQTSTTPTIWQRFLDDLCYLCDTESGGRSVVSIAVSQRSYHQCFFISANGGLRKAAEQLCLILSRLRHIKQKSDIDIERTKEELLEIGVRRSSMKVRNYIRELRSHIWDAERLKTVREGKQLRETKRVSC